MHNFNIFNVGHFIHYEKITASLGLTDISEFAATFARSENITYCNYKNVFFYFKHLANKDYYVMSQACP